MSVNSVETLLANSLAQSKLSLKQQNVLKAALSLFSKQGFDRTSTAAIAKAAGVSEGTVYKHFKTKTALLDALLEPLVQSVLPAAASEFTAGVQAADLDTLEAALQFLLSDRLQFFMDNRRLIRVFLQEVLVRPELYQAGSQAVLSRFASGITPLITKLQASGQLAKRSSEELFHVLFGLIMSYALPVLLDPEQTLDVAQTTTQIVALALPLLKP